MLIYAAIIASYAASVWILYWLAGKPSEPVTK